MLQNVDFYIAYMSFMVVEVGNCMVQQRYSNATSQTSCSSSIHSHAEIGAQQAVTDLLIGVYKQKSVFKLFFLKNLMKLFSRCANSLCVTTVNYIYDCLSVWVVASPVWSDASLAAQVPDLKLDVLVCHRFYIEANCCKVNTASAQFIQR